MLILKDRETGCVATFTIIFKKLISGDFVCFGELIVAKLRKGGGQWVILIL